jgi:hypothetical protein
MADAQTYEMVATQHNIGDDGSMDKWLTTGYCVYKIF